MENLQVQELTSEQIEELSLIADEAAKKHILSKIPQKQIETLNISVEAQGTKPITLTIDIDIVLSPSMKNFNVQELVDEAVKKAFASAEKYLREQACHSQK